MAAHSNDWIETVINRHGLPKLTEHTIASRDTLFDEIESVRKNGYATNEQEQTIGSVTVAAPVSHPDNDSTGAICISIPVARFDDDYCPTLINAVKEAANHVLINIQR